MRRRPIEALHRLTRRIRGWQDGSRGHRPSLIEDVAVDVERENDVKSGLTILLRQHAGSTGVGE